MILEPGGHCAPRPLVLWRVASADVAVALRKIAFAYGSTNPLLKYSVPDSMTRGTLAVGTNGVVTPGTPSVQTSYLYDFNSSLETKVTAPGGQVTTYAYDGSGRVTDSALSAQSAPDPL